MLNCSTWKYASYLMPKGSLWWQSDHAVAHLWDKKIPKSDLEWSTLWLLRYNVHKVLNLIFWPMDHPWWVRRTSDHNIIHLGSKKIMSILIWNTSAWWLLSYDIHMLQDPIFWLMSSPCWAWQATDHHVWHLLAKIIQNGWMDGERQLHSQSFLCKKNFDGCLHATGVKCYWATKTPTFILLFMFS